MQLSQDNIARREVFEYLGQPAEQVYYQSMGQIQGQQGLATSRPHAQNTM